MITCDPGSTVRIIKGVCARVTSCDAYDPFLETQCDGSDKTAQWAPYCETVNPCPITGSCNACISCPGDRTYIYADYECIGVETMASSVMTSAPPSHHPLSVVGCNEDGGGSPTITITCDQGSTIRITKGVCVVVTSCDAYDPSLETQCDNSDKTAQWAPYCETINSCTITGSCVGGATCPGDKEYISADYECISDEPSAAPAMTSIPPTQPPISAQADIVRQKSSLFKQIPGRRLVNHVIKTKHGLSLVKCGGECNARDDCVSFNIGNGVCELNNRVFGGGADVTRGDFTEDAGYKYYEKQ